MREREREKGDAKVGGQVIEPFEFIIVSTKKGPFSNISIHDLMDIKWFCAKCTQCLTESINEMLVN